MVVFFDIDGTLVDEETQMIPDSAIRALHKLRENGHIPVVNTGRPYALIDDRIRELPFSGWVCGCGTEVLLDGQWLIQVRLSEELCRSVREDVHACNMQVVYEPSLPGVYLDGEYSTHPTIVKECKKLEDRGFFVKPLEENQVFLKFVTYDGDNSRREEFLKRMKPRFTCIDRGDTMLEIVLKGHSKAGGMEKLLQHLGISKKDSMAIGDSTNDLPMFGVAGHTVCMGNGMEELKQQAEYITDTVLNDGIEKALQYFGLI